MFGTTVKKLTKTEQIAAEVAAAVGAGLARRESEEGMRSPRPYRADEM